jgi:hypothetical protein
MFTIPVVQAGRCYIVGVVCYVMNSVAPGAALLNIGSTNATGQDHLNSLQCVMAKHTTEASVK